MALVTLRGQAGVSQCRRVSPSRRCRSGYLGRQPQLTAGENLERHSRCSRSEPSAPAASLPQAEVAPARLASCTSTRHCPGRLQGSDAPLVWVFIFNGI